MMKKIKNFTLTIVISLMLIVLGSCGLMADATSIEISTMPKTVYSLNEEIGDFAITVKYSDDSSRNVTYSLSKTNGIKLSGFDTTTTGTKTATVKYLTFVATFEYTVVDEGGFGSGNGTEEYPYVIDEASDLLLLNQKKYRGSYFEIVADIDLGKKSGLYIIPRDLDRQYAFEGHIEGNHHKIIVESTATKESFLFAIMENATIRNLDIYSTGTIVSIADCATGEILLENVNRFGAGQAYESNKGNFFGMVGYSVYENKATFSRTTNCVLNNCNNYCDINNTTAKGYFSAFIGYPFNGNTTGVNISFNNCNNYAKLVGGKPAILCGNSANRTNISIKNCENYGVVEYVDTFDYIFGAKGNTETSKKEVTIENSFTNENIIKQIAKYESRDALVDAVTKEIILNHTDDSIAYYTVAGYFETHNDQNNLKQYLPVVRFNASQVVDGKIATGLFNVNVTAKMSETETLKEPVSEIEQEISSVIRKINERNLYYFWGDTGNGYHNDYTVLGESTVLNYTIFAYNANGEVIKALSFNSK